jgi:hypothetical protein
MLDSDMVFLDEPSGLLVPPGIDVALRPVHKKNIAASPGNPLPPLWKDVFELLPPARLVTTTTGVEGIPIVGYWNAGLVSSRASTRFFTRVLHNMLSLEGRVSFGGSSAYFRDQVAIAATIMHHDIPFVELPLSYNYPFNPFVIPLLRIESLDNIVCLHYHRRFEKHMFRNPLATDFCPGQRREWLDTRVHELGMFPPPWKVYKTHLARRVSARLHRLFSL